jgi:hypothetical protein
MPRLPEKAPFSPLRSARAFCLECQGGTARFVRECDDAACALRPWRVPGALPEAAERVLRGIRRHCLACAGDRREIRACAADACPLWPYRFGVMPATWLRVSRRFRAPKILMLPGFKAPGRK